MPNPPTSLSPSRRPAFRLPALVSFALACGVVGLAFAAPPDLGFAGRATPGLVATYARQFGTAVRERITAWAEFARVQKSAPSVVRLLEPGSAEISALQSVNSFFNRIPFLPDTSHWGAEDYWATPAETVASHGGDCEDYSIAKYFLLKEFGVPVERLRITYVKALKLNQAHMVLAYYAVPGAEPLILDNLEDRVRPASERGDLVPVYSFNDDDVVLVRDSRKSNPLQIRAWRDLQQKLEAEARL
jgi:predicted transglutaminase-like cysteine proteinase